MRKYEDEKFLLEIEQDEGSESPRAWDNLGTIVYGHRRYILGDEKAWNTDLYESWQEWLEEEVLKDNEEGVIYLPVYLYDHSIQSLSTRSFVGRAHHADWDSGQVGWIFATKNKFREETGYTEKELFEDGKALELLENEIKIFDQYIRGEVYWFALKEKIKCEECDGCGACDEDGYCDVVEIENCGGFYGNDFEKSGLKEELGNHAYLLDLNYEYVS